HELRANWGWPAVLGTWARLRAPDGPLRGALAPGPRVRRSAGRSVAASATLSPHSHTTTKPRRRIVGKCLSLRLGCATFRAPIRLRASHDGGILVTREHHAGVRGSG